MVDSAPPDAGQRSRDGSLANEFARIRTGPRSQAAPAASPPPERIGGRYRVDELLGRGGMAAVYRVTDDGSTGRQLALKQLWVQEDAGLQGEAAALFEREYHTLAQLSHPRVIEVYDYGLDERGPYYTMELLDGGDLKERCPLPWREACALLFDVCSSLALLHSRRLVHRDVSPRNIRCTRTGHAKLIDFGAMVPMGHSAQVVGTPAFVAPEVMHRLLLDARADLFSVGATLYYALTRKTAYRARDFLQLSEAWTTTPPPPSSLVADIPPALDALVMSLLSIDAALRPRSAFEVMQRLAAIADLDRMEPLSVSQAYLSTPTLVGRDQPLASLRARIGSAVLGKGGAVWIHGEAGIGRSRMLDACVLEAKTLGATVVRASADAAGSAKYAAAYLVTEQLLEAQPELARASADGEGVLSLLFKMGDSASRRGDSMPPPPAPGSPTAAPPALMASLSRWILNMARRRPLVIAVDDVDRIDARSSALLAALAHEMGGRSLFLAVTGERAGSSRDSMALDVLANACTKLQLTPLTLDQTEQLLGSVFGDVPNLQLVSTRIHEVAAGNPRACMELAQHLVDRGRIVYERGSWTLPGELDAVDLPQSAEEALRQRLSALSPLARSLCEAQALASHGAFTREDYAVLAAGADSQQLDHALSELLARQVLTSDGRLYSLAHRALAQTLSAALTPEVRAQRHRALAQLYERADTSPLVGIHHLLAGGLHEQALDRLATLLQGVDDTEPLLQGAQMTSTQLLPLIASAREHAQKLGRAPREIAEILRIQVMLGAMEESAFEAAGPSWLAHLERDSGLAFWRELEGLPAQDRLMQALTRASEQHAATPEAQRVYRPDEAIKLLAQYVVASIAVGARTYNTRILLPLPALLEPFAPLAPVLDAIWQNSIATRDAVCHCRYDEACARWLDVFTRLEAPGVAELPYVSRVRSAIAYALGVSQARMGLASSARWADVLDGDPLQAVSAMYLRRIMRLQCGDWEGAETFRKRAELLAIQATTRPMFSSTLMLELSAAAMADDLAAVKQAKDRIEVQAARYPGWVAYADLAEAQFQRLRGNLELTADALERCLALATPDADDPARSIVAWPTAICTYVETLTELGRAEEARQHGERALATCRGLGLGLEAYGVERALALVEAKLGQHAAAAARMQSVIDAQLARGVTGLHLGACYETRTRIAISANDEPAIEKYGQLTAQEYRYGAGSALGRRYERLIAEARRAGVERLPSLSDFEPTGLAPTGISRRGASPVAFVTRTMRGASSSAERATRALRLLCDSRAAKVGHLYLLVDDALVLAASRGASAPPAGMEAFVTAYHARELLDDELMTRITSEGAGLGSGIAEWVAPDGTGFRALLIACMVSGSARCAGVAVLSTDARRTFSDTTQLASAIAAHLIESGDVAATPAG